MNGFVHAFNYILFSLWTIFCLIFQIKGDNLCTKIK